ncbi:hypothetical protein BN1058_01281 [Paraliobacillus sp. PM-2]|uniref:hypothetical protein n=1 Tax=Paraliobacillus sp. PM-2 TaxID=1462524 RepID=UPI00061CBB6C|nr:hypothetical protein [Paraliobacillus sp. PM-2]CQR46992.1 hypothetical protein BN1058_01281 [Paraliobacillus sp. PM-2]
MYVIAGAFHWIGYHMIDYLLARGEEVIGIDTLDSNKKDHLLMSVGRNANFSFYEDIKEIPTKKMSYTQTNLILIDHTIRLYDYLLDNMECYSIHTTPPISTKSEAITYIQVPMLYGNWMSRNDNGLFWNKEIIPFYSQLFRSEAIFVDDFVHVLMQIIKSGLKPAVIQIQRANKKRASKDRSIIYIVKNREREEELEQLDDHFRQNRELY